MHSSNAERTAFVRGASVGRGRVSVTEIRVVEVMFGCPPPPSLPPSLRPLFNPSSPPFVSLYAASRDGPLTVGGVSPADLYLSIRTNNIHHKPFEGTLVTSPQHIDHGTYIVATPCGATTLFLSSP